MIENQQIKSENIDGLLVRLKELEKENQSLKEELRRNSQYVRLVENGIDGFFKLDDQGVITYLNKTAHDNFSSNNEIHIGASFLNLVKPINQIPLYKDLLENRNNSQASRIIDEFEIQSKGIRSLDICVIHPDKESNEKSSFIWIKDLTELFERKNQVRDYKDFYENVLNNFPSDIVVFSPEHKYLFANPTAIEDDKTRKWLIGKDDYDYCHERNKPRKIADNRRKLFIDVVKGKVEKEWEESLVNRKGEKEYYIRRMKPVWKNEHDLSYVIGYGFNVTQLRNLERQTEILNDLIQHSSEGVLVLNKQSEITFINKYGQDLLGVDLLGKNLNSFEKLFIDHQNLGNIFSDIKKNGFMVMEGGVLKKSGSIPLEIKADYHSVNNNENVILFFNDISKRKEIERNLVKSKDLAVQTAQSKADFLSVMSHEIRTPLNAIIGVSELLLVQNPKKSQLRNLEALSASSMSLMSLINDVLDFNKLENGNIELEQVEFDIRDVFKRLYHSFSSFAQQKKIELRYKVDDNVPNLLRTDVNRITQILTNLISNAIKFTPSGCVFYKVVTVKDEDENVSLRFSIKDTGIGIPKNKRNTIFDPFIQANSSITRKYGGTGLGLVITKKIIGLFNGRLGLTSRVGEGTVFYFDIKVKKATEFNKNEKSVEIIQGNFEGFKILLVDDNPINLLVAKQFLDKWGFEIIIAENGQIAVDKFDAIKGIDVVLMDLQMPVLDGYEAASVIRIKHSTVPIIALTANAEEGVQERCHASGINEIVIKPFKPEFLYSKLTTCLRDENTKNASKTD